jgi:hypothetical protein
MRPYRRYSPVWRPLVRIVGPVCSRSFAGRASDFTSFLPLNVHSFSLPKRNETVETSEAGETHFYI